MRLFSISLFFLFVSFTILPAQTFIDKGHYYAFWGNGNPTKIYWLPDSEGGSLTFSIFFKDIVRYDKNYNLIWSVTSIAKGEKYIGDLYQRDNRVIAFTYDKKNYTLKVKEHDYLNKGKLLEEKVIASFDKSNTSQRRIFPIGTKKNYVYFLSYEDFDSNNNKPFTIEFVKYDSNTKQFKQGHFTIADNDITVYKHEVTADKIFISATQKTKAGKQKPILYVYDLSKESLSKQELGLAEDEYFNLALFLQDSKLCIVSQTVDKKAYTTSIQVTTLQIDENKLLYSTSLKAGLNVQLLDIKNLYFLPNQEIALITEPNYTHTSTYQLVYKDATKDRTSYSSGDIHYSILKQDGSIKKSGIIEKSQVQWGPMGNNYTFISHLCHI